ncbi:sugar phosphate isomerase/epimerase family protein [Novosphingobium sp.]|uniref:sugar phosphate isomerase/epimerase family protein n=1 Tax=Novosphingobium sp. TaxID=1874826 RepID=UPI003B515E8D
MPGSNDLSFSSAPFLHVPLLDRLAPVRAAGFAAIAISPFDVWALEDTGMPAQEIAARITDAGLAIAELDCIACWMDHPHAVADDDLSRALLNLTPQRVIETAARIGARSVAVIDLSPAPAPIDIAAQAFARLCDMAAQHGLHAHIEFIPVGGIRSLGDAWAIVSEAGRTNGGITLDAWHFHRSGSTRDLLATIPGAHIHAVQLCDALPVALPDMWAELMTHRLLPGEGAIDLAGLIRTLDAIGCTAPIGVEVFNIRQNDQTLAETARDWATATRAVLATARTIP